MIDTNWRRPTREESAKGFIAMEKQIYYCQHPKNDRWPTGEILRESGFGWIGLTAQMIERRIRHGGELPAWIEAKERRVAA